MNKLIERYTPKYAFKVEFEYSTLLSKVSSSLVTDEEIKALEKELKISVNKLRIASIKLVSSIHAVIGDIEVITTVSEDEYAAFVGQYKGNELKGLRSDLWKYRRLSIRLALLNGILYGSKKKFSYKIRNTIKTILDRSAKQAKPMVAMNSLLKPIAKFSKIENYIDKAGKEYDVTGTTKEQLAGQWLEELAFTNMLDLSKSDHTTMVGLSKVLLSRITQEDLDSLMEMATYLKLKTISTVVPMSTSEYINSSSWRYKNDEPQGSLLDEYQSVANSVKYQFKDTALDDVELALLNHLTSGDVTLHETFLNEKWFTIMLDEMKNQIRASYLNGGHYCPVKGDSALRAYKVPFFGHYQTSKYLRALVKIEGIKDPIKMDMRNNIIQLYSVITRSKNLAGWVGTAKENGKGDIRAYIADRLNEWLKDELDLDALPSVYNKENIKPIFMVKGYTGGKNLLLYGKGKIETDPFTGEKFKTIETAGLVDAIPGEYEVDPDRLWDEFQGLINKLVPEMEWLQKVFSKLFKGNPYEIAKWSNYKGLHMQYASIAHVDEVVEVIDVKGNGHHIGVHSKVLEKGLKLGQVLPRWNQSFDALFMMLMVTKASARGIIMDSNHDAFIFDRQHESVVVDIAREIFIEFLGENLLADFIKEQNVNKVPLFIRSASNKIIGLHSWEKLTSEDILEGSPLDFEEL